MQAFDIPESARDRIDAARDPLTSESVLRALFSKDIPNVNEALIQNPMLPFDLLQGFIENVRVDLVIKAMMHPLITFEQVLEIAHLYIASFSRKWEDGLFDSIKSVEELMDLMELLEDYSLDHRAFFVFLLRTPFLSKEEFRKRVLHYDLSWSSIVVEDVRFDLESLRFHECELDTLRGVARNPQLSQQVLTAFIQEVENDVFSSAVLYENPNCPIELSAAYHVEHFDSYRWRPSITALLESKSMEYLASTIGDGPWDDLPLLWRLKMIVE